MLLEAVKDYERTNTKPLFQQDKTRKRLLTGNATDFANG